MRRRVWLIAALCALLHFSQPATADAWIWRLIDELSGPGPFRGVELDWRVVCFSEPEDRKTLEGLGLTADAIEAAKRDRKPGAAETIVGLLGPGCFFNPVEIDEKRRASINLAIGLFEAKDNELQYGNPDVNRDVKLTTLMPSFWWRPARYVEVGLGVGVWWFSGPAFDSFQRLVFQPGQLDLKPLALVNEVRGVEGAPWWDELLSLRAGWYIVPQGFRAEHFGAIPGTFAVSREALPTFAVFLDLEPALMELRRRGSRRGSTSGSRR